MKVNVLYLIKKNNNNKRKTKLSFYILDIYLLLLFEV